MRQETLAKFIKGPFPLQTTMFLIPAWLRQVKEQFGLQKAPVRVLFHQHEDLTLSLIKAGHITLFQVPPSFFSCCRVQIHLKGLKIIASFTENTNTTPRFLLWWHMVYSHVMFVHMIDMIFFFLTRLIYLFHFMHMCFPFIVIYNFHLLFIIFIL